MAAFDKCIFIRFWFPLERIQTTRLSLEVCRIMTDRELRKMSRKELLEMLLAQCKENESLWAELEEYKSREDTKNIAISNAGSLAEASLALSGVFESAQTAADMYLHNLKDTEAQCRKMIEEAEQRAAQIVSDAVAAARRQEIRAESINREDRNASSEMPEHLFEERRDLKALLRAAISNSL